MPDRQLLHDNHGKRGNNMTDTIELLETIGRVASLRHASAEELMDVLEQAHASGALKAAVASGDRMLLSGELGSKPLLPPQSTLGPAHEDEPEENEDDEPLDKPAPDHHKSSNHP
jgi:hypothetical protein